MLRFVFMLAVLVAAFFLFRETELVDRLSLDRLAVVVDAVREKWWSPLALIGMWTLLSPLGTPATPFLLTGGVVFGRIQVACLRLVQLLAEPLGAPPLIEVLFG